MKAVRLLSLAVILLLLCPAALGEGQAIPDTLRFSQTEEARKYLRDRVYTVITLPTTANDTVTSEMQALLRSMHAAGSAHIPDGRPDLMDGYLDTGAHVFRTGTKWMSFLSISSIAWEREQIYVDFDARAYDMETGLRLSLWDVVTTDALPLLESAVRTGLNGYFSTLQADENVLSGLCSPQVLLNTPFTLSPGRLTLHYRADLLYPGRNSLMHVSVPYASLAPYLTEEARAQTDNRGYNICALTFDDGPAGAASIRVLNLLRRYGAQCSFFLVGSNMYNYHYVVCREHDALQDVESHNWVHVYQDISTENVTVWKAKFEKLLDEIIGLKPAYMRAPGGYCRSYLNAGANLPMIQWSVTSTDAGSQNVAQVIGIVKGKTVPGSIILMHDLNPIAKEYVEPVLQYLEEKNYLLVTVAEMYEMYGSPLQDGEIYYSCEELTR